MGVLLHPEHLLGRRQDRMASSCRDSLASHLVQSRLFHGSAFWRCQLRETDYHAGLSHSALLFAAICCWLTSVSVTQWIASVVALAVFR